MQIWPETKTNPEKKKKQHIKPARGHRWTSGKIVKQNTKLGGSDTNKTWIVRNR